MERTLFELFKRNKGYLQTSSLKKRTLFYHLKKLLEDGEVVMIKRGLYRHNEIASADEITEVCKIVPEGILCLHSAWQFYELTTHISAEYHVAVPQKYKIILPPFPPVKLYYWSEKYFETAITEVNTLNGNIKIYSLEKSICDAMRFRNKIGQDMTVEILKNYLNNKDRNIDQLMQFAKELRVENILKQYLEIML